MGSYDYGWWPLVALHVGLALAFVLGYLRPFRGVEDGWEVRETTAGELVSVLYGPCAHVGRVILDPLPEIWAGESLELASVARKDFVKTVMGARSFGAASKVSGISEDS